ncbi:MAG TPA: TetR/AcrR family transcriptional regulator [Candidatus Ozemobacteraceae bacterium]|nr:TetR/AcrR family transcriptional regulator [Candidatus Ozemobacteraceae bacterium]
MATPKQIERERRIISAAMAEFCNRGFHLANVDDIATRANVGKATLYRHYVNKEGLFMKVFDHILDNIEKTIRQRTDFNSFRRGTEIGIKAYFGLFASSPEVFSFLKIFTGDESIPDGDMRRKLAERYLSRSIWAVEEIRRAQATEQIRRDIDPELLMQATLGMLHFLIYHWIRTGKPKDLISNTKMVSTILFEGLLPDQIKA